MRIRSTKPDFWRSKRIAAVDWDARLVLKGLESYVDDNGVGKDDLELIVGDLFQRDVVREPSRTLARVSEAISHLHQAGLVWRYEGDGTRLLFISFWEAVQRVDKPQAGRFPRPDGTYNYKDSAIRESGETPREDSRVLAPGTGEQGNRGTDKELSADKPPKREIPKKLEAAFDEFWSIYPRRVGKADAERKFTTAARRVDPAVIIAAAQRFAATSRQSDPKFIPHPATWLHQGRWDDDASRAAEPLRAVSEAQPLTHQINTWTPPGDFT